MDERTAPTSAPMTARGRVCRPSPAGPAAHRPDRPDGPSPAPRPPVAPSSAEAAPAPLGTVLFEPGLGEPASQWDATLALLATAPELARWRLVAHDRPGLGTEPARKGLTLTQLLATVDTVLGTAAHPVSGGPPAPLVLVGHSWGGTLVRLWAALSHRTDARLVLVDPSWENGPEDPRAHSALGPVFAAQAHLATAAHLHTPLGVPAGTGDEMRLFPHSLRLLALMAEAGRAPLTRAIVVTTSRTRGAQARHHRLLASSGARFLTARTWRHDIPRHDPATVSLAVRLAAREASVSGQPSP